MCPNTILYFSLNCAVPPGSVSRVPLSLSSQSGLPTQPPKPIHPVPPLPSPILQPNPALIRTYSLPLPASVPLPQSTPYSYTDNAQQDLTMKLDHSHNNLNSPCCLPTNLPSNHSPSGSARCLKSPVRRHGLHPTQHSLYSLTARLLNPKWSYSFIQILARHTAQARAVVARSRPG